MWSKQQSKERKKGKVLRYYMLMGMYGILPTMGGWITNHTRIGKEIHTNV